MSGQSARQPTIYLDADERTNRILMIGYEEQLNVVERLVDALDVAPRSLQRLEVYPIRYVKAEVVKKTLEELEGTGQSTEAARVAPRATPASAGTPETTGWVFSVDRGLVEQPRVVVPEGVNALLVDATPEQHIRVAAIINRVDVAPQDPKTLRTYQIKYTDAEEAETKLVQLGIISQGTQPRPAVPDPARVGQPDSVRVMTSGVSEGPQAVVVESTNCLVVSATESQHVLIAGAIEQIDRRANENDIPYRIYPLENSSPEHLAEILESLIQEKTQDEQDKISEVARSAERITIVPDPNTYSLIVYASMKNQEWISTLVQQLDKRRPQVLIDVTLVEITETEAFTSDLDLIQSRPDLASTSDISGTDPSLTGRLLQSSSGLLRGFYGDRHIQALLQTVQSKSYGRVLAKTKILVNDNEAGTIKTTDTTYVEKKSSVPITSGGAGNQQNLIETAVDYEPYEAGITLDITPHISEGELLRLDIALTRSDFLETADSAKPPNTTASEVHTAVTVPDGSTIILGGLLKLNQAKGGTKTPLLGDVPLIGGLFRGISNSDRQSKLYVFVKAEVIRPTGTTAKGMEQLDALSERSRTAFESHEESFQSYQDWPGIKPRRVEPEKVLEAQ
ncbi:MAG: hypothetical protein JW993_19350 [Sedimentisphaerales bacterium]|nr:hypothetical protein [Sedimentisphaerales bacterium]